jgi:hypothetical protein
MTTVHENADLRRVTANVSHGHPPIFKDVPTREAFQGHDVWNVQMKEDDIWENTTVPLMRVGNTSVQVNLLSVTGDVWFMQKDRATELSSLKNALIFALEVVKESAERSLAALEQGQ